MLNIWKTLICARRLKYIKDFFKDLTFIGKNKCLLNYLKHVVHVHYIDTNKKVLMSQQESGRGRKFGSLK